MPVHGESDEQPDPESDALESAIALIRNRLKEHNREALLYAALSLFASIACWATFYGAFYWLTLLVSTIKEGLSGREAGFPGNAARIFAASAAMTTILVALSRRSSLLDLIKFRPESTLFRGMFDFAMLVPRLTLSIIDNLRAVRIHSADDLEAGAELLLALVHNGPLPLSALPLAVPEDRTREAMVLTLQLIDFVALRGLHDEARLSPNRDRLTTLYRTGKRLHIKTQPRRM